MFKQFIIFTFFVLAAAKPSFVEQHHVLQPVLAKVGAVVHTAPSAVSHQSFTQVHSKAHIVTPVVHAVPVTHVVKTVAAPVVHTYAAPAIVKTVHAAPVVHHTYVAAPTVIKSVPTPVFNTAVSHQSHTQIHHKKAVITPIIAPILHAAPVLRTYLH